MVLFPALLLLIGIPDQFPRGLMAGRKRVETQFQQEGRFIGQIQALLPVHGMVFQLPYVSFPETLPMHDMSDYEEMKGYLHSGTLRWSYGAMKGRETDQWLAAVSRQPVGQMVHSVVAAGFAGIYIDRFGYADRAAELEARLRALLRNEPQMRERRRTAVILSPGWEGHRFAQPPDSLGASSKSLDYPLRPLLVQAGDGAARKKRKAIREIRTGALGAGNSRSSILPSRGASLLWWKRILRLDPLLWPPVCSLIGRGVKQGFYDEQFRQTLAGGNRPFPRVIRQSVSPRMPEAVGRSRRTARQGFASL